MSMRITSQMTTNRLVGDLARTSSTMADLSRAGSTGQKINKPSDDAIGTSQALRLRDSLAQNKVLTASTSDATTWISSADSALGSVNDLLNRAKELTSRAANATTSANDRAAIAAEMDSIISSVKDAANAKVNGQYVFSGQATGTAPYATATGDTYSGGTGVIARTIGPGVSVQVNADGAALFGSGGADGKLLSTLRTIQTHLGANDVTALSADLDKIATQTTAVAGVRATLGSTQNRVTAATDRLADMKTTTTKMLGDVQSADLPETLLQLSQQQTAYQAALKSGASIIQTSLLDFLS